MYMYIYISGVPLQNTATVDPFIVYAESSVLFLSADFYVS